jgi:hypothetical protein
MMGKTDRPARMRQIVVALALMLLAACGGSPSSGSSGGSSGGSSSSSGGTVTLSNFTAVTVDAGPAALDVGPNAYTATNIPYVTVTVCAPGSTTNCQTIDHVLLDTGSTGLRLEASVLNSSLLSGLTTQLDPAGNGVGECYEYVDNYVFGSVRVGDFTIGGESVSSMPLQVIGDTTGGFGTVPNSCSSSGGSNMNTVQALGANGIIGVGLAPIDCGQTCNTAGGAGGAIYYDCPASGCANVVSRAATTTAPYQQLPNPVAAFAVDNNGTVMSLPSVAPAGVVSVTGTIYFGIGTETNNALGSATVLPTDDYGYVTATYNGTALPNSFLDSGSNYYYFVDNSITQCTETGYTGFYCPSSALSLTPTISGHGGGTASAAFTLYNTYTEPAATSNAVPGIGANPNTLSFSQPITNSFDFGLPFFFGRNVYTAISGRQAGSTTGPYFAF